MTEALMWAELPPEARAEIETKGVTYVPSDYGEPYPITKRLIEEGRSHLHRPVRSRLSGAHPARHAGRGRAAGVTRWRWSTCCKAAMSSSP